MTNLTQRQIEILRTIIEEYTQTGEPVGSDIIDKKYNLGVSPATVRNEMTDLAKKGYLNKPHFSSGRIPTADAFRFYIQNLMNEKELSTAEEVSYKSDIWDYRSEMYRLLQQATRVLAKRTNLLAISTTSLGDTHYAGVRNLLLQKEFWDLGLACDFFEKLDGYTFFSSVLEKFKKIEDDILFMLGEEDLEDKTLDCCAAVYGEFAGTEVKGVIGVFGPRRMRYETVIPNVKYFNGLIEQILKEQGF